MKPQTPEFEVTEFDGRTLPLEDKSVDCFLTQEPRNPDDFANSEIMLNMCQLTFDQLFLQSQSAVATLVHDGSAQAHSAKKATFGNGGGWHVS